jgi:hypothetical protein
VQTETRCIHELITDQCATCTGRDGGEAAERHRRVALLDRPGVIAARFAGICEGGDCGERFVPGDPIATPRGLIPPAWRGPCCLDDRGVPTR